MKTWLEANWSTPVTIHAGTSTRQGGHSQAPYTSLNLATHVGDDDSDVALNRRLLRQSLQLPSEPVWLQQTHSTRIIHVDQQVPEGPADGAVTDRAGVVLAVMTADCLPLLLFDPTQHRLGAIHIGWRGFADGMVQEAMKWFSPADPCMAWLGPSIQARHYEIDSTVREACLAQCPQGTCAFTQTRPGHWFLDLPQMVEQQLREYGVQQIYHSGRCTHLESEHWYSYRRDGQTGRMATLIWCDAME